MAMSALASLCSLAAALAHLAPRAATSTMVVGRVVDEIGHAVADCDVLAIPRRAALADAPRTRSGPDGAFRLTGLPAGDYSFVAWSPRHQLGATPPLPVDGALTIAIHLDQPTLAI
jgi:hypothetical protein